MFVQWETLHAPENASEIRLILRELILSITYDALQQNISAHDATLIMAV